MTPFLLSALAVMAAGADAAVDAPTPLPDAYSMACTPTKTTGLRWRDGDWSVIEPARTRFVITQQPSNYGVEKTSSALKDYGGLWARDVCLNRRVEGASYDAGGSGDCSEFHKQVDGVWETTLTCWSAGLTGAFRPGGWYHVARASTAVTDKPRDGRKADQYLEVGKCAQVEALKVDEDEP